MSTITVPISETSQRLLQELTSRTGLNSSDILEQALDGYRRKVFLDAVNAGYAALRADPAAWAEETAVRHQWDACLMDGLDGDEHWTEDGKCSIEKP